MATLVLLSTVTPLAAVGVVEAASVSTCTTITTAGTHTLDADITEYNPSDTTPWCVKIDASNVVLDGGGHLLDGTDDTSGDESGVYVAPGVSNVTVRNLTVTDWSQGGITTDNASYVTVTDVVARSNANGVYVYESHHVTVSDSAGHSNGHAVTVENSNYADVDGVVATGSSSEAIQYLNSNHSVVANSSVVGTGSSYSDGIASADGTDITVFNNTIDDTGSGVSLGETNYSTVTENVVNGSSYGVVVSGLRSDHNVVDGNTITNGAHGVYVNDADDVRISNNSVTNNSWGVVAELYRWRVDRLVVRDNVVEDNEHYGVLLNGLEYSQGTASIRDAVLRNNTVLDNGEEGLILVSTTNVTMRDNTIAGHDIDFEITEESDAEDHSIVHYRHDIDTSNTVDGEPIRYLRNATGVVIDGSTPAGAIFVVDSSDVTVRDRVFSNQSVVFANAIDSRVENVTAPTAGLSVRYSTNLTVENARLRPTTDPYLALYGYGVGIRYSTDVTVANSTASEAAFGAVLDGTGGVNEGVTFRNFTASEPSILGWGMKLFDANDTYIVDSNLSVNKYGIEILSGATNTTIENTTIADNNRVGYGYGVEAHGDDTVIRNSTLSGNGEYGITFEGGVNGTIADTDVFDNGEQGIWVNNARSIVVDGNDVHDNGWDGISVRSTYREAWGHTLVDNVVHDNGQSGIDVRGLGNSLANNTVRNHTASPDHAGIDLSDGGANVTITGGTLENNSYGLLVGGTGSYSAFDNVTVDGTAIRESDVGVRLRYTSNGLYRNLTLNDSGSWPFYMEDAGGDSNNNTLDDVSLDGGVTVSLSGEEIALDGVVSPPPNPVDSGNVSAYVNLTKTSPVGYANLSVFYDESDAANVDESTLRLWRHDGSSWGEVTGQNTVDTTANVVSANVTDSGVVAALETPNAPPIAVRDSFATVVNRNLTVSAPGLLANDYDADHDSVHIVAIGSSPSHGSLSNIVGGGFTYEPETDFVGTDSFTYSVADARDQSGFVTVSIEILSDPNRAPTVHSDRYVTDEGTNITVSAPGVLENDVDPDGDSLYIAAIGTSPSHGSLSNIVGGGFTYEPDAGFDGTDNFTYRISDGAVYSGFETVTIDVRPDPNREPIAYADRYTTVEGQNLTVSAPGVLENDADPDNDSVYIAAIGTSPSHGSLSNIVGGGFTYEPDPGFDGTDSFTYRVADGELYSEFVTVTLDVRPDPNRAPTVYPDRYVTSKNQSVTVNAPGVLGNDYDPDNDSVYVAAIGSSPSHGSLSNIVGGGFTYTPNTGFVGTDSFTYRVSDGAQYSGFETVTVVVEDDTGNTAIALADEFTTTEGRNLTVGSPGVLTNDYDPNGDPLHIVAIGTSPSHGTLSNIVGGGFTYEPDAGFDGTDNFTYRVSDGNGTQSGFSTVTLDVAPDPNRAPLAYADRYTTSEGQNLTVSAPGVIENDYDPDNDSVYIVAIGSSPSHGTLSNIVGGGFTYEPDAGFDGTDNFTYRVSDGTLNSGFETVIIDVRPDPNREPVVYADQYATFEGQDLTVASPGLLANDYEPDGDPTHIVAIGSSPSNGSLSNIVGGGFTYTPNAGFVGTDSFTYRVADDNGNRSGFVAVDIDVHPDTNRAPTALRDRFRTGVNETLSLKGSGVLRNDYDLDNDSLVVSAYASASNGTVTLSSDGSLTYTPNTSYLGTDSFQYAVNDSNDAQSSWVTVFLEVGTEPNTVSSGSGGSTNTSGSGGSTNTSDSGGSTETSGSGGSTHSGSTGDSSGDSGSNGTATGDENNTAVVNSSGTAQTNVTADGDTLELNITGASNGDSVDVRLPDQRVDDDFARHGGALEGISTRFDGDGSFGMNVSYSSDSPNAGGPDSPPGGESLGYITVDHDASDEIIDEVEFTFRVSADRLASRGVDPADAVLYRFHNGTWRALETEVVETGDRYYRFRAVSPGLSVFAIGTRSEGASSNNQSGTNSTTTTETPRNSADQTATPTATEDPAATTERSTPEQTETETPGFGITVACIALLAAALLVFERKQ